MIGRLRRLFRKDKQDLLAVEVRALASDYVDEDLDETRSTRLRAHLAWCGPCQAFISTFSKTVNLLKRIPQESPPPGLMERIISKTREEKL